MSQLKEALHLDDSYLSLASSTNTALHRHPKFYFDGTLIFIQLENTIFSVHKNRLLKSRAFSKWFEWQASSVSTQGT
ncbi:hypothetical protein OPQ81_000399 [Rhizoctonia solani]|nr:hypothetical protein OPQ81_000399 [Rhizoctonia solani]